MSTVNVENHIETFIGKVLLLFFYSAKSDLSCEIVKIYIGSHGVTFTVVSLNIYLKKKKSIRILFH